MPLIKVHFDRYCPTLAQFASSHLELRKKISQKLSSIVFNGQIDWDNSSKGSPKCWVQRMSKEGVYGDDVVIKARINCYE